MAAAAACTFVHSSPRLNFNRQPPGAAASVTPPKTPARSPRAKSHRLACESPSAMIPFKACEAVSALIWAQAKAHAERAAQLDCDVIATNTSCASCSPPSKRRRVTSASDGDPKEQAAYIFPALFPSQPSQSQTQEPPASASADDAAVEAQKRLLWLLERAGDLEGLAASEALARVRFMAIAAMNYWREVSRDLGRAAHSLARYLEHQRRLYWHRPPWRGVNLGGWLLLEPGPSDEFFHRFGTNATCEWDLLQQMHENLGAKGTAEALKKHRDTFYTEETFQQIRSSGLNAVRIPFGYWTVLGPSHGDLFEGPCLENLDRALAWCKAAGLQALLDLHGAPGGESGEKPCGRQRQEWHWQDWRFEESIEALRVVAARYRGHTAVTGVAVCNEPSESVPGEVLCKFYDRAVSAIREGGMTPDEVAVILPVYRTERLDEIWRIWNRDYDGFARHPNVAFDLHLYHCFGPWWQKQGFGGHLKMARRHKKIMRRVPVVVGEWSLALPPQACSDDDRFEEDQGMRAFASAQVDAYSQASHGWFFWNWRDSPKQHVGWDLRRTLERQWLTKAQLSDVPATAPVGAIGGA